MDEAVGADTQGDTERALCCQYTTGLHGARPTGGGRVNVGDFQICMIPERPGASAPRSCCSAREVLLCSSTSDRVS